MLFFNTLITDHTETWPVLHLYLLHWFFAYKFTTSNWIKMIYIWVNRVFLNYQQFKANISVKLLFILNHGSVKILEFFLKVFTEFSEFRDKNNCHYSKRTRTCYLLCVRNQDVSTVPVRQMWETGSLSWSQFILQWFISFPEFAEFTEFNESSTLFRKNSFA